MGGGSKRRHIAVYHWHRPGGRSLAILIISFIGFWRIRNQAQRQLEEERARLEKQDLVPFEKILRPQFASKELTIWQSFRRSKAIVRFKDNYFVATDGGLVAFDAAGNLGRHYSVLDGLPESDLLSLAALGGRLFIGTRTRGLLTFDGERFWSNHRAENEIIAFAVSN